MIIAIDTSTPVCRLTFINGDTTVEKEWEANRELAKDLLGYLQSNLEALDSSFQAISGIIAYRGPGSFTGLRIGLTVVNTIADAQHIPIIGATGDDWRAQGLARLQAGENDQVVLPEYGGEANITAPRK